MDTVCEPGDFCKLDNIQPVLKTALIGCGFMGRMHSEVYGVLQHAKLVAVHDKKPTSASAMVDAHGARFFDSFDEILSDPTIDCVDICLPTYLHSQFTIKALEAGKHVVCEKPMALSLDDADAMIAAAKAADRTLMIAHCIRLWPEYSILKKLVDDGSLGNLLSINMTRFGAFPSWGDENWLADESLAGGGALDMHIHDTDFALYLLGTPDEISSWGTVDSRGVSQIFSTLTWGKTVGHLQGGWNLPSTAPFRMAFRAIFENGLANFDQGELTIYEEGKEPFKPSVQKMAAAGKGGNISDLGGYFFELDYFYKRVSEGKPVETIAPASSRESLAATLEEIRQVKERAN
jgi:predicted dehydrogenase